MEVPNTLRNWQDSALNDGWRIPFISYAKPGQPMTFGLETWAGGVALIGVLGFLFGLGYTIYLKEHGRSPATGLVITGLGFAFAASSIKLRAFLLRKTWREVSARCLDREVRRVRLQQNFTWDARILCEYEGSGAAVRCTPFLTQTGFATEGAAWTRVSAVVDNAGFCRLLINPKNPLHTEVVERRKV